jgi:hypothetical protein
MSITPARGGLKMAREGEEGYGPYDCMCWAFYIDGKDKPLYVVAHSINEAVDSVTEWCSTIEKIVEMGEGYYVPIKEE